MMSRRRVSISQGLCFLVLAACGMPEENVAQLSEQSVPKTQGAQSESEESTLGLVVGRGFDIKENWVYTDSKGNVPAKSLLFFPLFRPTGYDTFMGALRDLVVDDQANQSLQQKGRNCTGMVISEPTQAGASTFNIYILTAAHCFEKVNPIGFMTQKISRSQTVVSIPFRALILKDPPHSPLDQIERYLREFFSDPEKKETLTGKTVERSLNGDVARILLESGVSAEQAQRRSAVPLCSREYSSYSPDLVQRSGSRFRALIGHDGRKIHIKRMYSGASNENDVGVYDRNKNITNFINSWAKEYKRGGATSEFYTWTAGKAMGLDAGDSGLPVIEGVQTGNDLERQSNVTEFKCVSGVVTRSHWEMFAGRVGDTQFGINTAIIQRVWTNAQGFWENASPN